MKKALLLFAIIFSCSSAFAWTQQPFGLKGNDYRARANRNLLIGLGSYAVGTGICVSSYQGFQTKRDDYRAKHNALLTQLGNNEINQDQYQKSEDDLNDQLRKDYRVVFMNELLGGACIAAGTVFLVRSAIFYKRAKRSTAMITPAGFYLCYRF